VGTRTLRLFASRQGQPTQASPEIADYSNQDRVDPEFPFALELLKRRAFQRVFRLIALKEVSDA